MNPRRVARASENARKDLAKMLLIEVRKMTGKTQAELAAALGVKQPTISEMEQQDDMYISTLRRIVEALGGKLDIIVTFPGHQDVSLRQFDRNRKIA
jgi:transcriptional regulator with XRE-family HTH domain